MKRPKYVASVRRVVRAERMLSSVVEEVLSLSDRMEAVEKRQALIEGRLRSLTTGMQRLEEDDEGRPLPRTRRYRNE